MGEDFWKKKKKNINFSCLKSLTFSKVGVIMVSKHEHLMLPEAFPGKVTPDNVFAEDAIVQCDVRIVKILL